MNIPLKYEDVVAQLDAALGREAALREDLDQCGSMAAMIEDKEWAEHAGSGPVSSRVESAFTQLHNELSALRESYESMRDRKNSIVDLQQRLTVAEQLLSETLPHLRFCKGMGQKFAEKLDGLDFRIDAALKPAAEGEGAKPQEAYEVFPDSPGGYYNGCPPSALADPMQCWRDGYEIAKKRAITAGLKVKP